MDPDVESIVCYPGTKPLINLIKQMFAHKFGLEKMRLEDGGAAPGSQKSRSVLPTEKLGAKVDRTSRGSKKNTNHLQKIYSKTSKVQNKSTNGFLQESFEGRIQQTFEIDLCLSENFQLNWFTSRILKLPIYHLYRVKKEEFEISLGTSETKHAYENIL